MNRQNFNQYDYDEDQYESDQHESDQYESDQYMDQDESEQYEDDQYEEDQMVEDQYEENQYEEGGRRNGRNFFFTMDVAPRRASNHGPLCGNYRDKLLLTTGDGWFHANLKINMKSKREFLQKMNLTNLSNLMS